jgi:hypothetical protein
MVIDERRQVSAFSYPYAWQVALICAADGAAYSSA